MNFMSLSTVASATVITAIALTACGNENSAEAPQVATAQTSKAAAPASSTAPKDAKESDYDKALHYTRCMTSHGTKMADPVEGKALILGNVTKFSKGTVIDMNSTTGPFAECKKFLPTTWPVKLDAQDIVRSRAYDECLRKHGMNVPKPDADGMVEQPTDNTQWITPEGKAASAVCRPLYDDPAVRQDSRG